MVMDAEMGLVSAGGCAPAVVLEVVAEVEVEEEEDAGVDIG